MRVQVQCISGFGSNVFVPELDLAFDMGVIQPDTISATTVAISHGHTDHIGCLPQHAAIRKLKGMSPARYVMLPTLIDRARQFIQASESLNETDYGNLDWVSSEDEVQFKNGFTMTALRTQHRVDSVGYIVWSSRKKAEYQHIDGYERKALKDQHVELFEKVPLLAYTGDTVIEGVLKHPQFLNAETLIMECTFWTDRVLPDEAHERGHIHWKHVKDNLHLFKNKFIILTHLSNRHDAAEAQAIVDRDIALIKNSVELSVVVHVM